MAQDIKRAFWADFILGRPGALANSGFAKSAQSWPIKQRASTRKEPGMLLTLRMTRTMIPWRVHSFQCLNFNMMPDECHLVNDARCMMLNK